MKQHGQSNYVATHDSLVCPVDANKFEESSTSQGNTNINYWSSPPAQLTQFTCPKSQSRFGSVLLTSLARPTSLSPSPKYPDEDQNLAISLSLPATNFVEQDLEGSHAISNPFINNKQNLQKQNGFELTTTRRGRRCHASSRRSYTRLAFHIAVCH